MGLENESAWLLLLLAFSGSLALVANWLIGLLPGRRTVMCPRWLNLLLSIVIGAILLVDAERLVPAADGTGRSSLLRVLLVTMGFLAISLQGFLVCRAYHSEARWRRPAMMVLLLSFLLIAGWSSRCFYAATVPPSNLEEGFPAVSGNRVRSQRYVGVTDSGREIPLLRWQRTDERELVSIESLTQMLIGKTPGAIQREAPDHRSNCHGWVFTRGRFLLAGETVEHILRDNRYEVTTEPKMNDVVIYRDPRGGIVHTGLVAGILNDGSVIVESKWSVGARFLHPPERQPYSPTFDFYRSSRNGHSISIRFQNRSAVVGAPSETAVSDRDG